MESRVYGGVWFYPLSEAGRKTRVESPDSRNLFLTFFIKEGMEGGKKGKKRFYSQERRQQNEKEEMKERPILRPANAERYHG
jgi:hypothetical protein